MEAGVRANLETSRILALPKRDTDRAVLDFVKSLRSFSKVHAAEGKAHMAAWNAQDESLSPVAPKLRDTRSCGFATPVLKPRIAPTEKQKEKSIQGETTTRKIQTSSVPTHNSKSPNQTRVKSTTKIGGRERSKEAPPTRRQGRIVKRNRELQSDEEKRLHERREKKRKRREIMQSPGTSKKKPAPDDHDDQSEEKSKSKKSKKMPAGLALMYGFTATNVSKNRLTVEPSFRSGVFGKGKASSKVQVSRPKSKNKNFAFSEEDFLKSAVTKRRQGKAQSSTSGSQLSYVSSKSTGDERALQRKSKGRASKSYSENSEAPPVKKRRKTASSTSKAATDTTKESPAKHPSEQARSVEWDIEKDDGMLPTEDSSVLTRGPKPSTILLEINHKHWIPNPPLAEKELPGDKTTSNGNSALGRPVAEEGQKSPSLISSVRPSESPSQVANAPAPDLVPQQPITSKYFTAAAPQAPTTDEGVLKQALPEATPPCGSAAEPRGDLPRELKEDTKPPQLGTGWEQVEDRTADYANAHGLRDPFKDVAKGGNGSDWLLSDPVLGSVCNEGRRGADLFDITGLSEVYSQSGQSGGAFLQEETEGLREEEVLDWCDDAFLQEEDFFPMAGKSLSDSLATEEGNVELAYEHEYSIPQIEWQAHAESDPTRADLLDLTLAERGYDFTIYKPEDAVSCCSVSDRITSSPSVVSSVGSSELMSDPNSGVNSTADLTSPLFRFNEGHSLLLANATTLRDTTISGLDAVEADVARRLVDHWAPQRF